MFYNKVSIWAFSYASSGMVYMLGPNLIKYFPPEAENTLFTAKYEAAALIINTLQYRPLQNAAEIVFHITENGKVSMLGLLAPLWNMN